MAEQSGTFGGNWVSDDRTELAVEVIDKDGTTDVAIIQVWTDVRGFNRPLATDSCVQPEVLDQGWTYIPPS